MVCNWTRTQGVSNDGRSISSALRQVASIKGWHMRGEKSSRDISQVLSGLWRFASFVSINSSFYADSVE